MSFHSHPARPLWPYLLLNAAAAVWIAFSGIHRLHNSDSLMFGLASVYAWTPFFWEQDRVGMLVPLVASSLPDPVLNLVLQIGLTAFAGLCVPLFCDRSGLPASGWAEWPRLSRMR